jgi:hypothetical protein
MADLHVTKPLSQYLLGLMMVVGRVEGGNTTYFFGEVTNQSFKSYFPMVFLIKEPIPNLILMMVAVAVAFVTIFSSIFSKPKKKDQPFIARNWQKFKKFLREQPAEITMLLFIAIYLYTSITGNLNIGFRHLFPILPFAYILTGKEVSRLILGLKNGLMIAGRTCLYILILWLFVECIVAYPFYLAYFNEFVGGSKNGYQYVTDSNVDWGQDLWRLKEYVNENDIDKIRIDYFGGGDVRYYLGDRAIAWHSHNKPENGWYAISATFLQNSIYYKIKEGTPDYDWLRKRTPVAQIGNSILIYKVDDVH